MQKNIKQIAVAIQSVILMIAVFLSGAHAKDVVKLEAAHRSDFIKTHAGSSDEAPTKVSAELHNHVDKQTVKVFGHNADQQADRRSLYLAETQAQSKADLKFSTGMWLRLLAAKLML